MSLYAVLHNKAPLFKQFGNTLSLLACATLAALTVHSLLNWASVLFSCAVLLSSMLSGAENGHIWFQAFHLLGIYRTLNDTSDMWHRAICALLHTTIVTANLDSAGKELLNQVRQQATYAQGRYLIKLQKLRSVTLDDMWPLQERFQLRTAYSEFKYDTEESYFILRAIFRMMWRPMIPVSLVGLLLQIVPLLRIRLNSSIMQ
ncbi:hypothetical protein GGI20_004185, partial [Coemansia sp. BCRC 34301]